MTSAERAAALQEVRRLIESKSEQSDINPALAELVKLIESLNARVDRIEAQDVQGVIRPGGESSRGILQGRTSTARGIMEIFP